MSDNPKSRIKMQAYSRRSFVKNPGDAPLPEYVNAVEFSSTGMDVFMDVGVYSVEAANNAAIEFTKNPEEQPVVDVFVAHRFGMSMQTAMLMHQRLSLLIQSASSALRTEQAKGAEKENAG